MVAYWASAGDSVRNTSRVGPFAAAHRSHPHGKLNLFLYLFDHRNETVLFNKKFH